MVGVKAQHEALYETHVETVLAEKHLFSEPFYFKGTNGRVVLLVHGWTSVPYEMRALGKHLHQKGYSVYALLLSGHGTVPEDLEGIRWQQWRDDVLQVYQKLSREYDDIYLGGMSIGGSLVLHVAQRFPRIRGLVLMGTPYKMRFEGVGYYFVKMLMHFQPYKKKFYPKILGAQKCMTQILSYQRYPQVSAFEARCAIISATRQLDLITQPCFFIQSRSDHLVSRNSIHALAEGVSSHVIQKLILKNAHHNFIADVQHKHVYDNIASFFDQCDLTLQQKE